MVSWGFESSIFRHRGKRRCSKGLPSAGAGLGRNLWNSKHNRYCGGLLIRYTLDGVVSVRVRPVPPERSKEERSESKR